MVKNEKSTKELLKEIDFTYELHNFQMARIERLVDALRNNFGDEVIETIDKMSVNYRELLKWYLKHTTDIIDALSEKFGEEVMDIVTKTESADIYNEGKKKAVSMGENDLEHIIKMWGNEVIERTPNSVLIRKKDGCPASRISREIGKTGLMYKLSCLHDPEMIRGFNENFVCEVRKSHMSGDDCCEWYIYEKERG